MSFLALAALAATVLSLCVVGIVRLGFLVARRKPRAFARTAWRWHLVLVPIYALTAGPLFFAWFGSTRIGTRGDERAYAGPRIDAAGRWIFQSRETLAAEKAGAPIDPELRRVAAASERRIVTADGVALRAFKVPPLGTPRATVVLVHGLFRGGLELETPASLWRDLGAAVLMIEMRNHGASGRTVPTFGRDEREDVLAAAAYVRGDPDLAGRPLVLFAVSLGTVAVMRAAPDIPELRGVVLDAPTDDLLATAHRMLSREPRPGQRGLGLMQPFRSLTLTAVETWCGFRFDEIRPSESFARTSPDVPVLLVGGGEDVRMPPSTLEEVFRRLPTRPEKKRLWIRPGSDHGQVWVDDPQEYGRKLSEFLTLLGV
jgi:alpha-beta hydrolase superfamily lysophospholipase